jgi:Zn-dependent protease
MEGLLWYPLDHLPFVVLVLVIAFSVHEFAHAYSAYKFGDPTAHQLGRVTLNPMVHLDLFGTILLLIAGFGWAKPVPVNRGRFRKPRLMGIIVSAVGPLSNLVIAFIGYFILFMVRANGWDTGMSTGGAEALLTFLSYLITINIMLFLFNLIPIPPLDGYRILQDVLPLRLSYGLQKYEQWAAVIFLLFVFIPPLRRVTLDPLFSLQVDIIQIFSIPLRLIFGQIG